MSFFSALRRIELPSLKKKDVEGWKIEPETGKPLKENVIHGTTADVDFTTLSPKKAEDISEGGVFFTDNPSTALEFTGSVESLKQQEIGAISGARTVLASVDFKNPLVLDADYEHVPNRLKEVKAYALKRGYDGLVIKNASSKFNDGTEYVAFSTKPIKEFDFNSLRKIKASPDTVDFSSLKRKEFEGSFKRYDFSENSSGKKLEGIDFEILDGDGSVIGAVQAEDIGGGVLQVFNSSLETSYRGRGIGKEAYTRLLEAARERGFRRVVSDSSVSEDAIKVWESLGAVKGKGGVEEMQRGGSLDKKQFYTKEETPLYEITLE